MTIHAAFRFTLLGLFAASIAEAKPTFPSQIQEHLGLNQEPTCLLCHGSKQGGGPVTQSFGLAMLDAGLTSSGSASLTGALDKLEANKTDSNGDGIPDIEGLKQGVEPLASKDPIEYGCGGSTIAAGKPHSAAASLLALLTFGLLIRRPRSPRPRAR